MVSDGQAQIKIEAIPGDTRGSVSGEVDDHFRGCNGAILIRPRRPYWRSKIYTAGSFMPHSIASIRAISSM